MAPTSRSIPCSASGFAPRAFVSRPAQGVASIERIHAPSCACPACTGVHQVSALVVLWMFDVPAQDPSHIL